MNNRDTWQEIDAPSISQRELAADLIPGGSSTGSKRPEALYGLHAHDPALPTHFERADGCTVITADGRNYIDCTMALGAVAVGYADPAVTRAVQEAAAHGNVSGIPHRLEVDVAARLVDVIPSAEQVRFLRTGAEATAAAIRLARAATERDHIIACGYFGWLDWCSESAGVPKHVRDDITFVAFNDVAALDEAVARHGSSVAAIILEPVIHDIASREWLHAARATCDRIGAVFILDEIKTAFRIRTGGVQELLGVVPDLTTVGKAMANGYPLAAVVGRAAIMDEAMRTWISSTAAAESTGLAAARAVLDWHDRIDIAERLYVSGTAMQQVIRNAFADASIAVNVDGPPQMLRLHASEPRLVDDVVAAGARAGVLLKRGAYQFPSLAHDGAALDQLAQRLRTACRNVPDPSASVASSPRISR